MRSALAVFFLLTAAPATAADLSDIQTFLGQTAYEEAQISPDGARLAFIARRNDFEHDREVVTVWLIDLSRPAGPVKITEPGNYSNLRWSPDGRFLTSLASPAPESASQLLLLTPAAGAAPRPLTDPARFADGIELYEWLPDSSGLVFAAADSPGPASAETERRLRDFYGDARRQSPSPAPRSALYRLTLPDGRVERLATAPFDVTESLGASPDGRWLAVTGSGV